MDFTKILNIATDNDKRKLEELKIKKMKSLKMKSEGSLVKTDAIKSFLHKKEMEKRKKEMAEFKRKEELLNLRAAAKNNRKATAMAKRTKDNNFLINSQQQDDRTMVTNAKSENKSNVPVNRICSTANEKVRLPTTTKLNHVENRKYQQPPKLGKPEKITIPLKNPTRNEDVKPVIRVKTDNSRNYRKGDKKNLDFNSLMKLAKTKQYEPIVIETKPTPKVDTEGRLMTQSERDKFNEERTRKLNVTTNKPSVSLKCNKLQPKTIQNKLDVKDKPEVTKIRPEKIKNRTEIVKSKTQIMNGRQKLNSQQKNNPQLPLSRKESNPVPPMKRSAALPSSTELCQPPTKNPRFAPIERDGFPGPRSMEMRPQEMRPLEKRPLEKRPLEKRPLEKRPLEKRPLEKRPLEKRPLEKRPLEKGRLPPIGHGMSPRRMMGPPNSRFPGGPIRRRVDSDEEEDLDDFIDDGPIDGENEDYSKHIREIFGYDKRRYMNLDEDVDCMESSFARQMQEEAYSARVGFLEDLEDIRKEQEELERKYKCKKKKK